MTRANSGSLVHARRHAEFLVMASYEKSAITFDEYAKKVIDFAKSGEEVRRRELTDRRIQMLRDEWGPLLEEALESWYKPELLDLILGPGRSNLDLSHNPAKHIWQELSVLYKLPPTRLTPDNISDSEKYNKLLEDTGFNGFWQMVELLLNACREVIIWPDVVVKNGKKHIKHRVECGNTMSIIVNPDDKTEIECYVQLYETTNFDNVNNAKQTQYRVWTDKWYGVFVEDRNEPNGLKRVDLIDPKVTKDNYSNPYGFMPHVRIRLVDWQDTPWDITSGEDVMDLTITAGRERANYRYLQKISGFKQGVVTGQVERMPENIIDPAFLLKVPGHDTSFTSADWTVDLLSRQKAEQNDSLAVAARYGINPQKFKQSGDYQNSFASKSAERGLQEHREKVKPIMEKAENQYYKSVIAIASKHELEDLPSSESKLIVKHAPIAYPENPVVQADLDAKEIAMGTLSQIDVIKRKNPHLTEEQLKDELRRIMKDQAFVNNEKTRHNIADVTSADGAVVKSQSDQENGKMGPVERDKDKDRNKE